MNENIEVYCAIAKKLAIAKGKIAELDIKKEDYNDIRNLLDDCLEIMAKTADVAPIKLICN